MLLGSTGGGGPGERRARPAADVHPREPRQRSSGIIKAAATSCNNGMVLFWLEVGKFVVRLQLSLVLRGSWVVLFGDN